MGVSGAGGCDIGTFSWAVFFLAKVCAKTFLCTFYDEVALVLVVPCVSVLISICKKIENLGVIHRGIHVPTSMRVGVEFAMREHLL